MKKHYSRTTQYDVKGARMALDSLIHAQSAQEPTSTNRNAVLVDDGAIPMALYERGKKRKGG